MTARWIGSFASVFTLFLVCIPLTLIAGDECEIIPKASITKNREIAVKIGAELTALIKVPIGEVNLEPKYKSEFNELFQKVEESNATCAMVLKTITCLELDKPPNRQLTTLASDLTTFVVSPGGPCAKEKVTQGDTDIAAAREDADSLERREAKYGERYLDLYITGLTKNPDGQHCNNAIPYYQRSEKVSEYWYPPAAFQLAVCYFITGQSQKAKEQIDSAVKYDSDQKPYKSWQTTIYNQSR